MAGGSSGPCLAAHLVRKNQRVDDAEQILTRPIAVLDIDGVLADVRHRLHHLERQPTSWSGFFAAAVSDPLLPVVLVSGYDEMREDAPALPNVPFPVLMKPYEVAELITLVCAAIAQRATQ